MFYYTLKTNRLTLNRNVPLPSKCIRVLEILEHMYFCILTVNIDTLKHINTPLPSQFIGNLGTFKPKLYHKLTVNHIHSKTLQYYLQSVCVICHNVIYIVLYILDLNISFKMKQTQYYIYYNIFWI